nr:uncharacterized protein LOC113824361 [Penaeus vannamei]
MALKILLSGLLLLVATNRVVLSQVELTPSSTADPSTVGLEMTPSSTADPPTSESGEFEVVERFLGTKAMHRCVRTPRKCSNKGGFCLNLALPCRGRMDKHLCNNRHCGCCMNNKRNT